MSKKSFLLWDAVEKALAKNDKITVVFTKSNCGMSYAGIRIMEEINKRLIK